MEKRHHRKPTAKLITSYVFDWVILIAVGGVGAVVGNITPNKRPFQLEDPNISYVVLPLIPLFPLGRGGAVYECQFLS